MTEKRIKSDRLIGITKDHGDHKFRANMHSTGELVFLRGEESDSRDWRIEYKCDVCKEIILQWSADTHDLIREVLRENGVLK